MSRRGWGAATGGTTGIQKGRNNYYTHGDWNFICDICGFAFKAGQMRKLHVLDGAYNTCGRPSCYDVVNGQQFVRGIPERQNVPWSRPRQSPMFVSGSGSADLMTQPAQKKLLIGGKLIGGRLIG